jgi:hypothetical protein
MLNEMFVKCLNIQLTLKEVEIGIDLTLLDSIKIEWIAFNEYQKLAELEVFAKKLEIAGQLVAFGEAETAMGNVIKTMPLRWVIRNYLDLTEEQLESIEVERKKEYVELGFRENGTNPNQEEDQEMNMKLQEQQYDMNEMQMNGGGEEGQEDEDYGDYEDEEEQQQQPQRRR